MLIQLKNIHLSYGHRDLLDGVELTIQPGERLALVGRNGSGKSSLLKIIAGDLQADDGQLLINPGVVVARLDQDVPANTQGSVFDVVAQGLGSMGKDLAEYHQLTHRLGQGEDAPQLLAALQQAQQRVEASDGWTLNQQVEETLSRLRLDGDALFASLSGGLKRRVLLARALVCKPDLLLLDEPTNHLDIEAIAALEQSLLEWSGSLLFISHDRAFVKRLATRIIDLDRGQLSSWPGDYANYLKAKAKALEDEEQAARAFDKRLAQEEVWIRQGIKARRTRNEGRVRALKRLREERAQRVERQGNAKLSVQEIQASGKQVILAENISFAWQGQPVIRDFSCKVQRGDKIGIIGPNGVGKTTLIKLLLGKLAPDSGQVTLGTRLEVAQFDQHREGLNPDATVADNVADHSDQVMVNGKPRHVISYLQDFLFAPERAQTPVRVLSGGERNRLLLAKLLAKPANVLVMDEPTNDLDVETLELLEERLIDYPGTLLLVSHDRDFLDNVVTSTVVFQGDGHLREYVGGYSDWLRQRPAPAAAAPVRRPKSPAPKPARSTQLGLDRSLRKELQNLPAKIERLEEKVDAAQQVFAEPDFYEQPQAEQAAAKARLDEVEKALEQAMDRWEELEALAAAAGK